MRVQIVQLDANTNYTLTTKQLRFAQQQSNISLSLVSLVRPNFTLAAVLYLFINVTSSSLAGWLHMATLSVEHEKKKKSKTLFPNRAFWGDVWVGQLANTVWYTRV